MQRTQKKVLDYLATHPASTAGEIGQILGMTTANIRHHLQALSASQLVVAAGMRASGKRGRPVILFSLHQRTLAHNLGLLAGALLDCWLQNPATGSYDENISRLVAAITADFMISPGSLTTTLGRLVHELNLCHYQAKWEAHSKGPILRFNNCPYMEILSRHPELCRIDSELIQNLIHHPVKQIGKISPEMPSCIFQVSV